MPHYSLYVIDNPDSYKSLLKSEIASLKLKSSVARFLSFAFLLVGLLVRESEPAVLWLGLCTFLFSMVVPGYFLQSKSAEFGYYDTLTRSADIEFKQIVDKNKDDPMVVQFSNAILKRGRRPLVAESLRLKRYLAQKRQANSAESAALGVV